MFKMLFRTLTLVLLPSFIILLLLVLFLWLLVFSVPGNVWSFGLWDGNSRSNAQEMKATKAYKGKFYTFAQEAVREVDSMKDVNPTYAKDLKDFISPNAALGIAVARILDSSSVIGGQDRPKPHFIMNSLAPIYEYKTFQNDYIERRVIRRLRHSITHPFKESEVKTSRRRIPPHRELSRIILSHGNVTLSHRIVTKPWVTVSIEKKSSGHAVNGEWCTIEEEIEIVEREVVTRVDDELVPIYKEEPYRERKLLYNLGLKSERDVELAYLISRAERGEQAWNTDADRPHDCQYCYWNPGAQTGEWVWPVDQHRRISSFYGPRWGGFHHGIDIPGPLHTPILAAQSGVVAYAGPAPGYGNVIYIAHPHGLQSRYGHMKRMYVVSGQEVEAGQTIAGIGNEGRSTGPHLHFEVRTGATIQNQFSEHLQSINPLLLFEDR